MPKSMSLPMPSSTRPRAARRPAWISAASAAALLLLPGCKEDKKDDGAGPPDAAVIAPVGDGGVPFSLGALLGAFATCLQGSADAFAARATELEAATAAAAATPSDAGKLDAARGAFRAALDAWQVVAAAQVGPAGSSTLPGGQDLGAEISSWPLTSACAVDEALAARAWETPGIATLTVNKRGLPALEYLLFTDGAASACAPGSAGATAWGALSADERAARRRAYAAAAAADLRRLAAALADAWAPGKGKFAETLATAGPGNKAYPTTQKALNAVSDALFFIDTQVKDTKIARPAGLRGCEGKATCPELLESQHAGRSKANVAANLAGFRRLAEGCEAGGAAHAGLGFDDLLEARGAGQTAATLRARMAAAEAALAAIEEPDLKEALAADLPSVRALHAAVKGITDVLKADFSMFLDLQPPMDVASDND